jgi:hypothetical protein
MKVLLFIPPLTQFNTPYPSTAYLTSYISQLGYETKQVDLSLELILKIFSLDGLKQIKKQIQKSKIAKNNELLLFFLEASKDYIQTIDPVISFLQTNQSHFLKQIANRELLPEGPRFIPLDENQGGMMDLFNDLSELDKAKHISSLYLDDLADIIREGVDPDFGFSRYGEKLSTSLNSFNPLHERLKKKTLLDEWISELTINEMDNFNPDVIGLTVPFPGNLLGALRIAQTSKIHFPFTKIIMGGGYVNTELRSIEDPRIFEYVDYLTFDDGEKPLEYLLSFLQNGYGELLRTKFLKNSSVHFESSPNLQDPKFKNLEAPSYKNLTMNRYVSMLEMINPVTRLWSDERWNKLILAHGCYWKKCTFCDVSLDYIGRYEADTAINIVDKMEKVMAETKVNGFHFVDEAAPPNLLKAMSEEIIKRRLIVRWWGNIRFDPYFSNEVTQLMQKAGCIAVTGGIEVASPRVLKLIDKGISLPQVSNVTKNFKDAGIFVHAYLMYGFPTQTIQETIDSLEVVRILFQRGNLTSAYWHRFALTVHSPVGLNPEKFNISIKPFKKIKEGLFALNEIEYKESNNVDHEMLGVGLKRALYNYMLGLGLDLDVREWFDQKVPKAKISIDF